MSSQVQPVRGMNDVLPAQIAGWQRLERVTRELFAAYGFEEMRVPIVEHTALFKRAIGEFTDIVEKEMYTFVDQMNGESLTLRPEGTASCVRAAIEHNLLYNGAQRLCYMGPMFRHERPQKGRYRQFHQVGVEALGYGGPDIDAEHIVMCARLWKALDIGEVTLELNTLGDSEARSRFRERLIAYFEQHAETLDADAKRRLHSNPLRILDSKNPQMQAVIAAAPRMLDDIDDASRAHFEGVQALLKAAGVAFTLNSRLVRGLDYYTGVVFEFVAPIAEDGSNLAVLGGGRYDNLISQMGGKLTQAIGFGGGIERIALLLEEKSSQQRIFILTTNENFDGIEIISQLKNQFQNSSFQVVPVEISKIGKTLQKLSQVENSFAVVIGEREISQKSAILKNLTLNKEEETIFID